VQPQRLRQISFEILRARVAQAIRTAILRGELPPGCRVTQEQLAEQLGVSREPVREALVLLQREGLVHAQPNRRATVATLDRKLINDVYAFREAVEASVVGTLARLPTLDLAAGRQIVARGRVAVPEGDLAALIDLDMAFHTFLYESSGNRVVVDVMNGQWGHIRRVMAMVLGRSAYRQKVWDEHEGILDAIWRHRPSVASARAGIHVRAAKEVLLALFDAAPPAAVNQDHKARAGLRARRGPEERSNP
jgi:DNA-binding GntR family transcriptional regulator